MIVNEAGASVYSTSPVGREEFPDFDATLRSTISIGRRLQDPLAELVKIEPQNIGVGLYQHDVNPKQLKESLESVISSCVNFVGVDLNTASVPLLRHVSGLNQLTARRIVDYRKENGPFTGREQLHAGRGDRPGHLHPGGRLPQDPRRRPPARPHLDPPRELRGRDPAAREARVHARGRPRQGDSSPELHAQARRGRPPPSWRSELEVGELTLRDIIEALARPERDPRDDLPKPIFKKGVLKLEDLAAGMELKGTVLNVVDFGAFVDIGLKDSGLVHISQLANRYIKSPHDVVSVGDVVTVWVMGVDQERKRVSLTMVKPGTERQRGAARQAGAAARRRTSRREGQGPGPGPERPVRGPASQRLGADVAAGRRPLVATLAEPPAPTARPRPRRARGGPGGPHGHPGPGEGGRPRTGRRLPTHRPAPRLGPGPGPGRGGPRGGPFGHGSGPGGGGRPGPGRRAARGPQPAGPGPSRPSRPSPPPPPLSKEALTGSVPLRTFGQLKQLWEARVEPGR